MVESPGADRKRSAHWNEADTEILVDLLLKRRESGRTTDNGFKPEVWKEASELLVNAVVGGPKTPTACKSRWQRLQRDYKLVKDIETLPGFKWDRANSRLLASQEAWDAAEQQSQLDSSRYQKLTLPQYDALAILCPPEGIRKRVSLRGSSGGRNSLANSTISDSGSMLSLGVVSSSSNSTEGIHQPQTATASGTTVAAGAGGSSSAPGGARTALPASLSPAFSGSGLMHLGAGMMWNHSHSDGQISPGAQAGYGHSYDMTSHYPLDAQMLPQHTQLAAPRSNDPSHSPQTQTHPRLSPVIQQRLPPDPTSIGTQSPQLQGRASPSNPSKRTRTSTRNSLHLSPHTPMTYLSPTIEYANPLDGYSTTVGGPSSAPGQSTQFQDAPDPSASSSSSTHRMPPPHRNSGSKPITAVPHPTHLHGGPAAASETTPNPTPPLHSPLMTTMPMPNPPPPSSQIYMLPSNPYPAAYGAQQYPNQSQTHIQQSQSSYPQSHHHPNIPTTTATSSTASPSLATGAYTQAGSAGASGSSSSGQATPIPPELAVAGLSEAQRRTEALLQLQEKESDMHDEDLVEVMAEFEENMAAADTYLAIKKTALRKLWLGKLVKRRRKG